MNMTNQSNAADINGKVGAYSASDHEKPSVEASAAPMSATLSQVTMHLQVAKEPTLSEARETIDSILTGSDIIDPDNIIDLVDEIAELADPMSTPLWEIDDRFLHPFAELPPVMTWGRMGDRPAIECQGITTLSAKPKQGKSLSLYAILSSIVSGVPIDTFTPNLDRRPRLVMIFDTEMNKPTLQRRVRGIFKMLGEQRNRFLVVPLLGVPKSDRINVIEVMTKMYQPDIVGMDVVTKLINDYNSSEENSRFGDWIEKYAENRSVLVVIHQNKDKENTNMKGHLGTLLGEAAVENYNVSRKDSIMTMTPVNARNSCAEGAGGMSFMLNEDGTLIGAAAALEQQRQTQAEVWRKDLAPIFGDDDTLKHNELQERIKTVQNLSDASARRKIKEASDCGAIVKISNEKKAPYKLT